MRQGGALCKPEWKDRSGWGRAVVREKRRGQEETGAGGEGERGREEVRGETGRRGKRGRGRAGGEVGVREKGEKQVGEE